MHGSLGKRIGGCNSGVDICLKWEVKYGKMKTAKGFRSTTQETSGLELNIPGEWLWAAGFSRWKVGSLKTCMGHRCLPFHLWRNLVGTPPLKPSLDFPCSEPLFKSSSGSLSASSHLCLLKFCISKNIYSMKPLWCLWPERTSHFSELPWDFPCTAFILWLTLCVFSSPLEIGCLMSWCSVCFMVCDTCSVKFCRENGKRMREWECTMSKEGCLRAFWVRS